MLSYRIDSGSPYARRAPGINRKKRAAFTDPGRGRNGHSHEKSLNCQELALQLRAGEGLGGTPLRW
jgi:hypothetical protein